MAVLSSWTEGILLSITFILVITLAVAGFNSMYGKSNVVPLVDNSTMDSFKSFANSSQSDIHGGTVLTGSIFGVNIAQSYKLLTGAIDLIWTFISGNWLANIGNMLLFGSAGMALMTVFQVIWILGIVSTLLYVFFKVII
jgi:hypothetical protein